MGAFKMIRINNNIGVLSKTLNSVAAKHGHRIEYDTEFRKVHSHCDANAKPRIIREVMGILDAS